MHQDVLNDQMKQKRTEIDWSTMEANGTEEIRVGSFYSNKVKLRYWLLVNE